MNKNVLGFLLTVGTLSAIGVGNLLFDSTRSLRAKREFRRKLEKLLKKYNYRERIDKISFSFEIKSGSTESDMILNLNNKDHIMVSTEDFEYLDELTCNYRGYGFITIFEEVEDSGESKVHVLILL